MLRRGIPVEPATDHAGRAPDATCRVWSGPACVFAAGSVCPARPVLDTPLADAVLGDPSDALLTRLSRTVSASVRVVRWRRGSRR